MKNINISFIFLIIGAIIGAGFSSGKEIVVFFSKSGKYSFIIIFLVIIFLYFSINQLILFGKISKVKTIREINSVLFNKQSTIFDIFIVIGIFIFLTAMIAGLNAIGKTIFFNIKFPILTIISIFFSFFICEIGYSAIKKVNNFLMPIVVIFLIIVSFYNVFANDFGLTFCKTNFLSFLKFFSLGICYIAYNLVFSSSIIIENSQKFTVKETKMNSLLFSLILGGLILIINIALLTNVGNFTSDLPMLNLAFNVNNFFGYIFSFILWFSIITSLISSLYILVNSFKINHFTSSTIILSLSFIFSFCGFDYIVNFIYPLQGIIGLIVILKIFKYNKQNNIKI